MRPKAAGSDSRIRRGARTVTSAAAKPSSISEAAKRAAASHCASSVGAGNRTTLPLRHRTLGREADLDIATDGELVERLDPAQPGLDRCGAGRLVGQEGNAREDAAGAGCERRPEVEGRPGGGEEALQHEEAEVARLLRAGPALGGGGGGAERTGRVEGVPVGEPLLVGGEGVGGCDEPLRRPARARRAAASRRSAGETSALRSSARSRAAARPVPPPLARRRRAAPTRRPPRGRGAARRAA